VACPDEYDIAVLAQHRYIETRPKTLLKVYHFDVSASEEDKQ
jgi:hypothetical protein